MATRRMETDTERTVRQKLLCRIAVQWMVFLGLFTVTSIALEFLYGPPQRPSFDLVRQSFGRHGLMFAAIFALVPIAIRDSLRGTMKAIAPFLKEPEKNETSAESQAFLDRSGSIVNQVEQLREMVASTSESKDTKARRESETPAEELVAT